MLRSSLDVSSQAAAVAVARLSTARSYIQRGFSVIPIRPGDKRPLAPWKEFQERYATDEELVAWFGGESPVNIGIVTGKISRITVLDIDSEEALAAARERGLPPTPSVKTARGFHFYFAYKIGVGNFQKRADLPGIDLRGDGGYVVGPPSVHESGSVYEWADGQLPFADLPEWVTHKPNVRADENPRRDFRTTIHGVAQGSRDQSLFLYACSLRALRLSQSEAQDLVSLAAQRCCPPFSASLAIEKVRSAYKYVPKRRPNTELGNAERIVDLFATELRYAPGKGWLVWDGKRWCPDDTDRVFEYAAVSARLIESEIADRDDDRKRAEIRKWSKSSESRARLSATIDLAAKQSALVIRASELDKDPWLINLPNGLLDLRSQSLTPSDSSHLVSKVTTAVFDPAATCPTFISVLQQVIGDDTTMEFIQRWFGLCLTGEISEQKIVTFCGSGANGKSTILNAIRDVLGEYAVHIDGATLTGGLVSGGQPRSDLARLASARFATVAELESGVFLSESLLKQMSGGDPLTCRIPYEKTEFQFVPAFKLVIATNDWPRIRGNDEGIWRRLILILFRTSVPAHEQDKDLGRKLGKERSGILNWMLEGLRRYLLDGLPIPATVADTTSSWREAMDPVGTFISHYLNRSRTSTTSSADIADAYAHFCVQNDHQVEVKRLRSALRSRFEPHRTKVSRGWWVELRYPGDGGDS